MPESEWEGSDELNDFVDMLSTYNVGEGPDDYDTRQDIYEDFVDYSPDDWGHVGLTVNGDGDWTLSIDGNEWDIGRQGEFEEIYGWLDELGIEFDIEYEG